MIFESVFVAVCTEPYLADQVVNGMIDAESLRDLKDDGKFRGATQFQTAGLRTSGRASREPKLF